MELRENNVFVIDIVILCYLYVVFYLGKFRKIKNTAAITWRVVIFVMVTSVLKFVIIFQLLMPTDWSKTAYLPSHNLTREEMGLVGVGAWTLTWFYPIWATPFYLLGQYRDYAYQNFEKHYSEELRAKERENNKKLCFEGNDCTKHFVDINKSDKDGALELIKNFKEKFNSVKKCDDIHHFALNAKYTLGLSMRKLKDEYGIDLYKCLKQDVLFFFQEYVNECLDLESMDCYKERLPLIIGKIDHGQTEVDSFATIVHYARKTERTVKREEIVTEMCKLSDHKKLRSQCEHYFPEKRVYKCIEENSFDCYKSKRDFVVGKVYNPRSTFDREIYSLLVYADKFKKNEARREIIRDVCSHAISEDVKKMCTEYLKK